MKTYLYRCSFRLRTTSGENITRKNPIQFLISCMEQFQVFPFVLFSAEPFYFVYIIRAYASNFIALQKVAFVKKINRVFYLHNYSEQKKYIVTIASVPLFHLKKNPMNQLRQCLYGQVPQKHKQNSSTWVSERMQGIRS